MVRYRIVEGDTRGNFTIDSLTGEVRPTGVLDYEQTPRDGEDRVGRRSVAMITPSLGLHHDCPGLRPWHSLALGRCGS